MADLPIVVGAQGLVPRAPVEIWKTLLSNVAAMRPGYTANLPGSLVEDVSSTDVAAIVLMDNALVDLINALTPYGANAFILAQLGEMYGVPVTAQTNTSVNVVFFGPPGYLIKPGFTVADSSYSYVARDGGAIGASGQTAPLFCVATTTGTWVVLAGTVTRISTSVPSGYNVTCSNPLAGTSGLIEQTETAYRAQVLQAGRAAGLGMPSFVKTQLQNVQGVQSRLISVQQTPDTRWKIIVGGGDIYEVAYAIYSGILDIAQLEGSTLNVTGITMGANAVVTTDLNHTYITGQIAQISGITSGTIGINNVLFVVTVITGKSFSTGVNTSLMGAYTFGGVLTPNNRNQVPSLTDFPDVYAIPYVQPPAQTVAMTVSWSTSAANFVNNDAVAQLAAPAIAAYVNSVPVTNPLNLGIMGQVFNAAVASILDPTRITRLVFAVSLNGVGVAPAAGTIVIAGDPESYFQTNSAGSGISVSRT
jgi:hypothetical protein